MRKGVRTVALTGLVSVAALAALAPAALGKAYVDNQGSGNVSVLDIGNETVVGAPIPVGAGPLTAAITPDGSRDYVSNSSGVSVINTQTNTTVGAPIPVAAAFGIAITPDGTRAYVVSQTNPGSVSVIDTQTNTVVGSPITVGVNPVGIAITPDGTRAYVTNNGATTVTMIDIATNTAAGAPIPVGGSPRGIAITPDGTRAYVVNNSGGTVSVINTQTNTIIGAPIPVAGLPVWIAITPDGTRAYVTSSGSTGPVTVIDTGTNTTIGSINLAALSFPQGIAITPNGGRLYVADQGSTTVSPINVANSQVGTPITVGTNPFGIAIAPNQPPTANLTASGKGLKATLKGGGSKSPDGKIVSYDWNFGDGSKTQTTTPTVKHTYHRVSEFTATLSVSDGDSCPGFVFTGQTAYCNGPSVASVTGLVAAVKLGKLKRNEANGTATLVVKVPGKGKLTLAGKGLVKQRPAARTSSLAKTVQHRGTLKLRIRAKGKKRRALRRTGKVKLKAKVTFKPQGGFANTQTRKLKLIERR